MPDIILEVNGFQIPVLSAQILHSMHALAAGFKIELAPMTNLPKPGDICKLWLGNKLLLDGYIDTVRRQLTISNQQILISGRDKMGDLVDCYVPLSPSEYYRLPLDTLINELIQSFDISLIKTADVGEPIPVFSVEPSETIFQAIQRACSYRSRICYSDRRGHLLLSDIGDTKATTILREGKNILQVSAETSSLERFSEYKFISQRGWWVEDFSSDWYTLSQTNDEKVTRYRPWLGISDMAMDDETAEQRIQWEKTVREGRSQNLQLTVVGWQQGNGDLWEINQLVPIKIPRLNLNSSLIASQVNFQFHPQQGWRTQLKLAPREAHYPAPVNEPLSLLQQLL